MMYTLDKKYVKLSSMRICSSLIEFPVLPIPYSFGAKLNVICGHYSSRSACAFAKSDLRATVSAYIKNRVSLTYEVRDFINF